MLYRKKDACQCLNILVCDCLVTDKCSVMLADFDYVSKIGMEPRRCEGTLTYRSPEVSAASLHVAEPCLCCCCCFYCYFANVLIQLFGQGYEVGTHSDIYSMGVLLLHAILGRSTDDDAKNVSTA